MILNQVTRLLCQRNVVNQFTRFTHQDTTIPPKVLFPLTNRKLVRVAGLDAPAFLHGLVTNDMRHFEEGAKCMYAMFLNTKGRVLYDTIIYKWEGENSFLVECDAEVVQSLEKYLKIYKLKRLVSIDDVNDKFKLWVLIAPQNTVPELKVDHQSSLNIYKDPRLPELGHRILTSAFMGVSQVVELIGKDVIVAKNEKGYSYLRYKLGVCEGFNDLPPGARFPLEANCDYLHGVSFHKGCYIGQELIARVYYTGVIRKRIMPIKFLDADTGYLPKDTLIVDSENPRVTVGKLVGCLGDQGIGLIRLKEALEAKQLSVADHLVEAIKPNWWPIEAPKEKVNLTKIE